jgi:dienelactone hydrolase
LRLAALAAIRATAALAGALVLGAAWAAPAAMPVTTGATAGTRLDLAAWRLGDATEQQLTLTDTSRGSPARGDVAGASARALRTIILRPSAPGPLPLVVFAQGFDTLPEMYLPLLDFWAAAGYLVLAPEAPGASSGLPGPPTRGDILGQAADLSFVISQALTGVAGPVDPARIAVAGHSDGATAVAALALNPSLHDARIGQYLVLSGAMPDGADPSAPSSRAGALLVAVGDADEYGNLGASAELYGAVLMPKAFVVAQGGDHAGTYLAPDPLASSMRAATRAFLDSRGATEGLANPGLTIAAVGG